MSTFAAGAVTFVERVLLAHGYPGLLILMLAENLFPPLPSELVLPFVGYQVARGTMDLLPVLAVSTLGSVLGAAILYGLAARVGEVRVVRFIARHGGRWGVSPAAYDRAAKLLSARAPAVLFWSRFVPGMRSIVSIPAGVARIPLPVFLLWTGLASFVWNAALVGGGLLLGRDWPRLLGLLDRYRDVLIVGGASALVGFAGYRLFTWIRRRRARAGIG